MIEEIIALAENLTKMVNDDIFESNYEFLSDSEWKRIDSGSERIFILVQ
jgi:hypothetical protein